MPYMFAVLKYLTCLRACVLGILVCLIHFTKISKLLHRRIWFLFRGVLRTRFNIYDGVFLQKEINEIKLRHGCSSRL